MKKIILLLVSVLFILSLTTILSANEDIKKHSSCKYCGMDREKFAHSRMLIEYDDGTQVGTCSLHCTAIDLALNLDKTPKLLWVGDYLHQGPAQCRKGLLGDRGGQTGGDDQKGQVGLRPEGRGREIPERKRRNYDGFRRRLESVL